MTALRVGLLGFSGFGEPGEQDHQSSMYLPALVSRPDVDIVAVAATDPREAARAAAVAAQTGAVEAPGAAALLDRHDIDGVVVCAPLAQRAAVVCQVIEARKNVLADKPLALTGEEVARIATALHAVPVAERPIVGVAHHLRLHPIIVAATAAITAGRVGLPWNLQGDFVVAGGRPCPDGELPNLGVHAIDTVLALLGLPARRVHAIAAGPPRARESAIVLCVDHDNTVTSTISIARTGELAGFATSAVALHRYRVSGSHGTAVLDLSKPALRVHTAKGIATQWAGPGTVARLVGGWVGAALGANGTVIDVQAAARTAAVVDAARQSLRAGAPHDIAWPD